MWIGFDRFDVATLRQQNILPTHIVSVMFIYQWTWCSWPVSHLCFTESQRWNDSVVSCLYCGCKPVASQPAKRGTVFRSNLSQWADRYINAW